MIKRNSFRYFFIIISITILWNSFIYQLPAILPDETEQVKKNISCIDSIFFITCLQNLSSNLNIKLPNTTDPDSILATLIEQEGLAPSDTHKQYLLSNLINATANFLTINTQTTISNTTALIQHLEKTFKSSIEIIKNNSLATEKHSFFQKKYLFITLSIIITLAVCIAVAIKISNNHKKAVLEKQQQHKRMLEKVTLELTDMFKKQLSETQENAHETLTTIQTSVEKISQELEEEKIPNTEHIDAIAQKIDSLETHLQSVAKDYEKAKETFEHQQEMFDKVLQHGDTGLKIAKWQQEAALEELRQKMENLNKLKEKLKQKRTWLDDVFENFTLEDASNAIDTTDRGLGVFESGVAFLKKIFGFGEKPKQSSLAEQLEAHRDSGFSIRIPTHQPKVHFHE